MPAQNQSNRSGSGVTRWLIGLVALQALTLMIVLGDRPLVTPAAAQSSRYQDDDDAGRRPQGGTLPNAAEQRADQVRLLERIAEQLKATNGKLDALTELLRSGEVKVSTK